MSESKVNDSLSCKWIYAARKAHLVNFLSDKPVTEIYNLLPIDDLRKLIIKWYGRKEKEAVEEKDKKETTNSAEFSKVNVIDRDPDVGNSKNLYETDMEHENWTFNPKREDWDSYVERLELCFEVKEVKPEKKTAHLLTKVGMETYKLIRELCAPVKPKDKDYKDLVELVKNHYNPKRNEAMERCKFQKASQAPNETMAKFVARLKELALFCNFADLNMALRDQLVCGIGDHDTRVALFSEEDLTYEKAVQIATTRESAMKNAARTEKEVRSVAEMTVKHLKASHRKGYMSKSGNKDFKNRKFNVSKNENVKSTLKPNENDYVCFCCGKINNHYVNDCRLKNVTCNSCKGKGHIEKICFKKYGKKKAISNIISNHSKTKTSDKSKLNYSQINQDSESEEKFEIDFCPIFEKPSNKEQCIFNITAEPHFKYVEILKKKMKMEVDTGAYVTIISELNKNKLFPNINLAPSDLILTGYNAVQLNPIGVMKKVEVIFRNEVKYLDLYVLKGEGPSLLGRQWLKAFGCWPIKLN